MVLIRLGDIITNKYRNYRITKELYEIEKKKNFQIRKKEETYDHLVKNINIMAVMI